ncbi:hypothetical protein JTB14_017443 [Gonioctena quinquepunctata]|nr:hypothetical protein JTB14_017443 [Gonioctena quinquepunctata]
MANEQTAATGQNQPLNSREDGPTGGENADSWRLERIKKIKEKFLPGFKITLLLSLVFNLAMFIIGILAVNKCPVSDNIPLYLIATGVIGILSKIITYLREQIMRHFKTSFIESALYTSELVFMILGSYWVYKVYPPSYDPADGRAYCQKTAYMFAFVYLTFFYAIIMCVLCGFICFLCCICCIGTAPDPDVEANDDVTITVVRVKKKTEPKTETA